MMELAEGEHVAFLTQDATPAHDGWLAALLEGFEQADDVALVYGPHVARADASHMIKAEMERHFATFGNGGREIEVQRLGRTARELEAYRALPGPAAPSSPTSTAASPAGRGSACRTATSRTPRTSCSDAR